MSKLLLVVIGLVAVGIALQIGSYGWQAEVNLGELDKRWVAKDAVAVGLVFFVLGYIVVSMLPAKILQTGSLTNIIAHAVGFLLGVCFAHALLYEVDR